MLYLPLNGRDFGTNIHFGQKKKHRLISQKQTMDIVDTNTSDIFYLFLRKQKFYSISDKSLKTQIALISP